ncbi:MAG: alpha/beta fold hydrolase [Acidimicrobiales bacterium]
MTTIRTRTLVGHEGVTLVADHYVQPTSSRPPVILLHGGGQNRHAWEKTARAMHAAGHDVVAYDTRGHGDSGWDPAGRYLTEDLSYDLLAVREQFYGRRPTVAVGASLGGMTILTAQRIAPPHFWAGIVLVDVTPRIELDGARRVVQFMSAHPDGFANLDEASETIAAYNPHRARPDSTDGLTKVLRQRDDGRWVWRWDPAFITSKVDVMHANPAGAADRFEQTASQLLDGARRITAPALLVRGAMSDLVSPESVDEFLTAVPHASAVDVSNTGHMIAGDDNNAFTTAVLDFLGRITPTAKPVGSRDADPPSH